MKDMNLLGRNYVQTGMLREQLRRANVRLTAVNEDVGTGSCKAKGESGKHVAGSPLSSDLQ